MAIKSEIPGFEMHEEIGSGGMAVVYRATQTSLGREVAIKVLRRSLQGDEAGDFQKRFLHEGQLLAKLNHPNIVPIHDIGQTEDHYYMAMEFLKGGTLTDRIKEGMSVSEVIRICTQIAHALELAHRHSIVHRDLKPSNIMFRDELTPVLTDFGIAKKTDTEHGLTKTGMVVGTPYYMSPEQITGKGVDGRSDLYSLGVMFYELLVGELPFRADEPLALAMQHVQEEPPPLPDDLAELQPIMDRMLAKAADDRYANMLGFCEDIKNLVMSESAFARKLSGETKLFNSDQFSDPRFGSGGQRRRSGEHSGATSVMSSGERRLLGGIGWKIPAAVTSVLLAVLAAVYFFVLSPGSDLSSEQRKVVDNLLVRVNGYISVNQIDQPESANAVDVLKKVLQIAPDYPDAIEAAERIAEFYEVDAKLALESGDIETAVSKIEGGLAIAPAYEPLQTLKTTVDERIAERQRRERIAGLLEQAAAHVEAGRLIEPKEDNAYLAYQQVLELDNVNQTASTGLNEIQQTLIEAVRQSIDNGQFDVARSRLSRVDELFPRSSLVAETRQQLFAEQRRAQEELEVSALLAQAERQLNNRNFIEPDGDNALENFQRVLEMRPNNEAAIRGLTAIADHFEQRARESLQAGNQMAAVDLAAAGLRASPDSETLLEVQNRAIAALDAASREIQQLLQQAERFASDGRFLGEQDSALASYRKALELDPGNERARQGLDELPDRIFSEAERLRRAESYTRARRLLADAASTYPEQARFVELDQELASLESEQEKRERLERLLTDTRRLVETRPITEPLIGQTAAALKSILREYPNEVNAVAQLGQFTNAIAEAADQLSQDGDDEGAFSLIQAGLEEFPDNRSLVSTRQTVSTRQQQRLEEEKARLAAMSGQLAVDAMPWGEVVEIRDAQGKRSELPSDSSTPLLVSLLEGDYTVTVRGGNSGEPVTLDVSVQRQKLVTARAEFDSMSSDRYFERSGW